MRDSKRTKKTMFPPNAVCNLGGAGWQRSKRRGEEEDECERVPRVVAVLDLGEVLLEIFPRVVHQATDKTNAVTLVNTASSTESRQPPGEARVERWAGSHPSETRVQVPQARARPGACARGPPTSYVTFARSGRPLTHTDRSRQRVPSHLSLDQNREHSQRGETRKMFHSQLPPPSLVAPAGAALPKLRPARGRAARLWGMLSC